MRFHKRIIGGIGIIGLLFMLNCGNAVFADAGIGLSPMNTKIVLVPGDVYEGEIKIVNPDSNDEPVEYEVSVLPFFVNEGGGIYYEANGDYNEMANWITVSRNEGVLAAGGVDELYYKIDVPDDVPAVGQYAAIMVNSKGSNNVGGENSFSLDVTYGTAFTIMAEISGKTVRNGEITDANVPSFLLSGNISGSSTVVNTGNVHGVAKYTLQVFPLFSDEEIYTNEEKPEEKTVMPDRSLYHETSWDETPDFGIFNVIYTTEFNGVTTQVNKLVLKCPVWMLFIVVFIVVVLVAWIVVRKKQEKSE